MYLTNSFFAASKFNTVLERLLKDEVLSEIDLQSEYINRTTGPYFLRSGIQDVAADKVFMFDSAQVFPYNNQPTPYKPEAVLDEFIHRTPVPGSIEVKPGMYYQPGGTELLQTRFLVNNKGPLAIYHSGLGGTWSS
jgi:hypothetical protein